MSAAWWTQIPREKVLALVEAGKSVKEISAELGKGQRSVQRMLVDIGAAKRRGRPSKLDGVDLGAVLTSVRITKSKSLDEAAAELGVSARTLEKKLREYSSTRR